MDGSLNKIATALIAVFAISFLLLLAQILFFFSRRRHHHAAAAEPEEKCFYLFCWRNQSRIEPKEIASKIHDDPEAAAIDDELEKWRELCGPSRTLFTINEEDERDGIESFEYDPKLKPPSSSDTDVDEDTPPFHTPCGSPPFFTPSPSPTRDAGDFLVEKDSSDDNGTAPFLAIEISGH